MALPTDSIVQVTITSASVPSAPVEIGRTLAIVARDGAVGDNDDRFTVGGSRETFAASAKFPSGSEGLAVASAYFGASPAAKPLIIGEWNAANASTEKPVTVLNAAGDQQFNFVIMDARSQGIGATEAPVTGGVTLALTDFVGPSGVSSAIPSHALAFIDSHDANAYGAVQDPAVGVPDAIGAGDVKNMAAIYVQRAAGANPKGSYAGAALAARMSAIDFTAPNSLLNPKFKTLTGVEGSNDITPAGVENLRLKHCNYYSRYGVNDSFFADGYMGDGSWIDTRYWQIWLQQELQNDLYTLLRTRNRVTQDARGLADIKQVINGVLERGRINGGIAPGTLSSERLHEVITATGNAEFDPYLPRGYYTYVPPITTLTATQRAARQAPTPVSWITGAGAINELSIQVVMEE